MIVGITYTMVFVNVSYTTMFSMHLNTMLDLRISLCLLDLLDAIIYILSIKRNAMFLFAILGLKIVDFKTCFNSVVLPSNKDLDCIVSS